MADVNYYKMILNLKTCISKKSQFESKKLDSQQKTMLYNLFKPCRLPKLSGD